VLSSDETREELLGRAHWWLGRARRRAAGHARPVFAADVIIRYDSGKTRLPRETVALSGRPGQGRPTILSRPFTALSRVVHWRSPRIKT